MHSYHLASEQYGIVDTRCDSRPAESQIARNSIPPGKSYLFPYVSDMYLRDAMSVGK